MRFTEMKPSSFIDENVIQCIVSTGDMVEKFLNEHYVSKYVNYKQLTRMAQYIVPDMGLRLRPFLLRVSYEGGERTFDNILPLAAGIELIQLSTLVIDDILDESPIRNGKLSVSKKWGIKNAVAGGIALFSEGLTLICDALGEKNHKKNTNAVLRLITQTHTDIYIGQIMDIQYEKDIAVSEKQYLDMICKTTAAFIQTSLAIGAMIWDAPSTLVSKLKKVGYNLGMAYQIRDDVIDLLGEPELTGKPNALDLHDRKMRLPVIHALKYLDLESKNRLIKLIEGPDDLSADEVEEILYLLEKTESVRYVMNETKRYCYEADTIVNTIAPEFGCLKQNLYNISKLISHFDNNFI
jgi:geranylgeranyl pyrophosphate synthase